METQLRPGNFAREVEIDKAEHGCLRVDLVQPLNGFPAGAHGNVLESDAVETFLDQPSHDKIVLNDQNGGRGAQTTSLYWLSEVLK